MNIGSATALSELGDVRTRDESPPGADQDNRLDAVVRTGLRHAGGDVFQDSRRNRIYRRITNGDHAHPINPFQRYEFVHKLSAPAAYHQRCLHATILLRTQQISPNYPICLEVLEMASKR